MNLEFGNYTLNFSNSDFIVLKIFILLVILVIIIAILKLILSEETKYKIKNWIGAGFFGGLGLFLFLLCLNFFLFLLGITIFNIF